MYRHLLIATDGSELAWKAVVQGLELAEELGAKVTAITVTEPLASMVAGEPVYPTQIDEYEKAMGSPREEWRGSCKMRERDDVRTFIDARRP